ncbi:MAG TPA: sialate O-acetylesterase, partial [Luteolibacter sp.]|nr:sialate O-acetylesterase [Luteolibacter sp.]
VMLLKSCIGNRALGWDLLPPGSKGFDFTSKDKTGKEVTYTYAGYKESPMKWEKGTTPTPIGWYAGKQWDDDVANAKTVLGELDAHYPGATKYEVAGVFWWQGEKDCGDEGLASRYEENLVTFIKAIRKEFNSPNAKFVMGTLGEAVKGQSTGNTGKVLEAMLNVDGASGKYPEFKGNVGTVYTHDMARGGGGNGHYGKDSRVYMDVGIAMGEKMVELLKSK